MDDPFLQAAKRTPVNLEEWAVSMMEKSNRKSHLQQPLSPATKALLRDNSPPKDTPSAKTPTSGEIPIEVKPSPGSVRENHPASRAPHMKEPNGAQPQPGSSRPGYPPRTSSASSGHSAFSRGGITANLTTLPIRPAPPPAGPLPTPPGSSSGRPMSSGRPQVPRKSSYQSAEQEPRKENSRWQPTIPMIGGKQYHQNGDPPPY